MIRSEERIKIINMIDKKLDAVTSLTIECFEYIYRAAWNEAIEMAIDKIDSCGFISIEELRKLKK